MGCFISAERLERSSRSLLILKGCSNTGLWFPWDLSNGVRPVKAMELSCLLLNFSLEYHWLDSAFYLNLFTLSLFSPIDVCVQVRVHMCM